MPLSFDSKRALVAEVSAVAQDAHSVVAAEYRGLSVADMDELRRKARGDGVYLRVVKNTLARRALEGTAFEALGGSLSYGFIARDDNEKDVFVHSSAAIAANVELNEGDTLTFDVEEGQKGPSAVNLNKS